jgi:DNA primase
LDLQQIKLYLKDNPELIKEILEEVDCHHIKIIGSKRVQSALPYPSDNPTSIQITLNDNLTTYVNTKNDFDEYEVKDIFTLIQYIKNCTLTESRQLICDICDITYTISKKKTNTSGAYDFLKKYVRDIKKEEFIDEDVILDESFKNRFVREDCQLYLDDGVNSKTQEKFGVSYDVLDNRIVIPIRNDDGKLITFKGRTCVQDYKIRGIPKFINYYPALNNNHLFGLYENYYDILMADEIYTTEAEKGVLQLDSMGINNAVAVNKKKFSDIQIKKLFKLGKPIVLTFDKDVALEQIFIECRKFKGLIDLYYIYDTLDLLKGNESPVDKGIEIFNQLRIQCKFKYRGE